MPIMKTRATVTPIRYPHRARRGPLHTPTNPDVSKHYWLVIWDDRDSSLFPVRFWSASAIAGLRHAIKAVYFDHKPGIVELAPHLTTR